MSEQVNFPGYLTAMWVFLIIFIIYVMKKFANPKDFPWHSYPTIFVAYFSALGVLLIIPLDVSLTVISRRSVSDEEDYDKNAHTLVDMYVSLFLPAQILSGFVLVLQEAYNRDGHFTILSKLYSAIASIAIQSIAGGILGLIFFGILVGEGVVDANANAVLLTIVLLSNTAGLVVIMLLLGYGLVSFPQMLWHKGNIKRQLNMAQQKAATRFKDLGDISLNMSMTVADVMKTKQELASYNDPDLDRAMAILVSECPSEFTSARMGKVAIDKKLNKITINSLASLRSRLFTLRNSFVMSQGKVEEAKKSAYYFEDIIDAVGRTDCNHKQIKWSFAPESTPNEYTWHVIVKPAFFRVSAVVSAVLTVFSFLGIIGTMHGVGPAVSVYSIAVHSSSSSGGGICVFVLLTLSYTTFVIMWSVFQMRIANMMELLPAQRTSANSLSVNSRACCKLSAPLAFFYLGWIFENGIKRGPWTDGAEGGDVGDGDDNTIVTAFANFYQIDVIPVMGGSFNTLFPIIVFSVSGLVLLNLFNRILVQCKLEKFQFGAEILTDEQLREGTRQLSRHKRTMERAYQRKALRAHIDGTKKQTTASKSLFGAWGFGDSGENIPSGDASGASSVFDEESGHQVSSIGTDPPPLCGWVEKKQNKKLGASWQNRYMIVQKPGTLVYYKDENTNAEPAGQVDLRLVMSFTLKDTSDDKKLTEAGRLDLDLADRTLKLRFKSIDDASMWRDNLALWKDYAIDYGTFFPSAGIIDADGDQEGDEGEVVSVEDISKMESSNADAVKPFSLGTTVSIDASDPLSLSTKPPPLEGWLEKKQQSKLGMASWQRRYFRVVEESSSLQYFKSDSPSEIASGSISLTLVADVGPAEKKEGRTDAIRFDIDTGDRVYKLRAASTADGSRWIDGINAWREHCLLNF